MDKTNVLSGELVSNPHRKKKKKGCAQSCFTPWLSELCFFSGGGGGGVSLKRQVSLKRSNYTRKSFSSSLFRPQSRNKSLGSRVTKDGCVEFQTRTTDGWVYDGDRQEFFDSKKNKPPHLYSSDSRDERETWLQWVTYWSPRRVSSRFSFGGGAPCSKEPEIERRSPVVVKCRQLSTTFNSAVGNR